MIVRVLIKYVYIFKGQQYIVENKNPYSYLYFCRNKINKYVLFSFFNKNNYLVKSNYSFF